LNTKIAEEETFSDIELDSINKKNNNNHDDDDVILAIDEIKETNNKADLLTNSFAYLKLSPLDDKTSLELKSISLRENANDHLMMRRSSNSHSYSANSKSNVCVCFSSFFCFVYII
jgi:hypothetical protein